MRRVVIICLLILVSVVSLHADLSDDLSYAGDAGHAAAFLYLPVGAKAMGVAGAYTALGDDPTAVFYNPATLVKMDHSAMSFSGTKLSLDRYRAAFSAAFRRESSGGQQYAYAFSAMYTTVTGVEGYDSGGNPTGELPNFSFVGQFSFASGTAGFKWGATAKYIHDSLDDTSGSGAAVDLGCEASLMMLKLGFSVRNIGFMRYDDTYWLKPVVSGSFAYAPTKNLAVVVQLDKLVGIDAGPVFRVASEFTIVSVQKSDDYADAYQSLIKNEKKRAGGNNDDKKIDLNKPLKKLTPDDKKKKGDGIKIDLDKPLKSDPPPADGAKDAIDSFSLKGRIGLADGNIAGGLTFQWQMLELSYALSLDGFEEGAGHHLTLNYRF